MHRAFLELSNIASKGTSSNELWSFTFTSQSSHSPTSFSFNLLQRNSIKQCVSSSHGRGDDILINLGRKIQNKPCNVAQKFVIVATRSKSSTTTLGVPPNCFMQQNLCPILGWVAREREREIFEELNSVKTNFKSCSWRVTSNPDSSIILYVYIIHDSHFLEGVSKNRKGNRV